MRAISENTADSTPNIGGISTTKPAPITTPKSPVRERVAHPERQHLAFATHPDAASFGPILKPALGTFRDTSIKVATALRTIGYYDIPQEVMNAMRKKPRNTDPHLWSRIQQFVEDAVSVAAPQLPYSATLLRGTVTRYVVWAITERHLPLDGEIIWTRELIDLFVTDTFTHLAEGTRAGYRSHLDRINRILSPEEQPYVYTSLNGKKTVAPYTAKVMKGFKSWATGQANETKRQRAFLMLALSAGAGLSSTEVGLVHPEHVLLSEDGILIEVQGTRPRRVPLLAEWDEWLIAVLDAAEPGTPLWGATFRKDKTSLLSSFVENSQGAKRGPRGDRLRNTWIVWHLDHRTPMVDLFTAAGVRKMEHLGRLLKYCEGLDAPGYLATLSGRSGR